MSKVTERLILTEEENPELIQQHLSRYEFASGYVLGKKVLDVACGSGFGSASLSDAGASFVLGVDVSPEALMYASQHHGRQNVEFKLANAEQLNTLGDFDVVVSFETIEHLPDPEKFLGEIARALRRSGVLLISTPVADRGDIDLNPKNPFHLREWSRREFEKLLSKYFPTVTEYGQYNFEKWGIPYSRTLQRRVARVISPDAFKHIAAYPVLPHPPKLSPFRFRMAYIILMCQQRP